MDLITVPVLQIGTPTATDTIYPLEAVEQALVDASRKKFVCQTAMPTSLQFGMAVMLTASHVVERMHIEGDMLYADLRFLDTIQGKELRKQCEAGEVVFSIAALGDVDQQDDGYLVVKDMSIIGVHVA